MNDGVILEIGGQLGKDATAKVEVVSIVIIRRTNAREIVHVAIPFHPVDIEANLD